MVRGLLNKLVLESETVKSEEEDDEVAMDDSEELRRNDVGDALESDLIRLFEHRSFDLISFLRRFQCQFFRLFGSLDDQIGV